MSEPLFHVCDEYDFKIAFSKLLEDKLSDDNFNPMRLVGESFIHGTKEEFHEDIIDTIEIAPSKWNVSKILSNYTILDYNFRVDCIRDWCKCTAMNDIDFTPRDYLDKERGFSPMKDKREEESNKDIGCKHNWTYSKRKTKGLVSVWEDKVKICEKCDKEVVLNE